jgi:hypothetical protein
LKKVIAACTLRLTFRLAYVIGSEQDELLVEQSRPWGIRPSIAKRVGLWRDASLVDGHEADALCRCNE